ncbi:MAG: DNA methyltransferase [Dehalococcoidales bacterium]|nr:DNA methyltransferase [Dehalococcoidales bacterium]
MNWLTHDLKTNVLYYGDNLDILQKYIPDNCVDLIYLDPPFNSRRDYNILFKENGGIESEAQIKAFGDSWHWTQSAQDTYQKIVTTSPIKTSKLISALHDSIGQNDVMAYLVMMTIRLSELRRVLKPTGSLYLHCDPTASHYLKIILDQIFGPTNFKNEIVWKRSHPKGLAYTRFASTHDIIFAYSKDNSKAKWNMLYTPHTEESIKNQYTLRDGDGRLYQLTSLLNPNPDRPNLTYEFKGIVRVWRWTKSRMLSEDAKGKIVVPKGGNGIPRYKRFLDEQEGIPIGDFWADIEMASGSERLGYDTQKPIALLERIISSSSEKGDIVLDPFCGCGTAIIASQKLGRKWIGIDLTHLAINLMRNRLRDSFPKLKFEVIGEPQDLAGARELAHNPDRYQFQWWALGKIGARPMGEKKKGADQGIDGIISFIDNTENKAKRVVVQVKSGHVGVSVIRELQTVAYKEAIGVLITLESPTTQMIKEAVSAGYYHSPIYDKNYPKIQIITVEELFQGQTVEMPPQTQTSITFTKAPKINNDEAEQGNMIYQHKPTKNDKLHIKDASSQLPLYKVEGIS